MGRTAYSSANKGVPLLQEESQPFEEEMQGRRCFMLLPPW